MRLTQGEDLVGGEDVLVDCQYLVLVEAFPHLSVEVTFEFVDGGQSRLGEGPQVLEEGVELDVLLLGAEHLVLDPAHRNRI